MKITIRNLVYALSLFFLLGQLACIDSSQEWKNINGTKSDVGKDQSSPSDTKIKKNDSDKDIQVACSCDLGLECNDAGACVECVENSSCQDISKSLCANNSCTSCKRSADCGHLGDFICEKGTCVECTRDEDCEDNHVCNQIVGDKDYHKCSNHLKGKTETCHSCVSNTQCVTEDRCVATTFNKKIDYYCLELKRSGQVCTPDGGPYFDAQRTDLNGKTDNYCAFVEDSTSCPAILQHIKKTKCGTEADGGGEKNETKCEGLDLGAKCVKFGAWVCSYACLVDSECRGKCLKSKSKSNDPGKYCE